MRDDDFSLLARRLWLPFTVLLEARPYPPERAADERAVTEVLTSYAAFYDGRDLDRLSSLFAEDALLVNPRGSFRGRPAIERNFAWLINQRRRALHTVSNVVARPGESGDCAWLSAYYQVLAEMRDGEVRLGSGTYFLRLGRSAGPWQIRECRIADAASAVLVAAAAPPSAASSEEPPTPTGPESSANLPP
jgi:ketosteroid isomerase-like protein